MIRLAEGVLAIAAVVALTAGAVFVAPLWLDPESATAVGRFCGGEAMPGGAGRVGWIEVPLRGSRQVAFPGGAKAKDWVGHWVSARGRVVALPGGTRTLQIDRIAVLHPVDLLDRLLSWYLCEPPLPAGLPRGLLLLFGVASLTVGFYLLRAVAALLLGLAFGGLVWVLILAADPSTSVFVAAGAAPVCGLAVACVTFVVALHPRSFCGAIALRFAGIALLAPFLGELAAFFGWPTTLTRDIALFGALVSPAVSLWLLSGLLLALGLGATGAGAEFVLHASGIALAFQERKSWIPRWRLPGAKLAARFRSRHDAAEGAEV